MANGCISATLMRMLKSEGYNLSETMVILGAPRSGSTWLAELVSTVDGVIQVFEPMNPDHVPEVKDINYRRNMYKKSNDVWAEGKVFFDRALAGKVINPWTASQIPPLDIPGSNRLVVKFVRANLILDWLVENYNLPVPAVSIRHPCAIIASNRNKQWPAPTLEELLKNRYFDSFPKIKRDCQYLDSPLERAAISWCLRYHPIIFAKDFNKRNLVVYEALVADSVAELKPLFESWHLKLDWKVTNQIKLPSKTSMPKSQIKINQDPLSGWKKSLTSGEVNKIIDVLKRFNIEVYGTAVEPDMRLFERVR